MSRKLPETPCNAPLVLPNVESGRVVCYRPAGHTGQHHGGGDLDSSHTIRVRWNYRP